MSPVKERYFMENNEVLQIQTGRWKCNVAKPWCFNRPLAEYSRIPRTPYLLKKAKLQL
jgi:hypothetical protein